MNVLSQIMPHFLRWTPFELYVWSGRIERYSILWNVIQQCWLLSNTFSISQHMSTIKIRVIQQCWIKVNTVESYSTLSKHVLNNWRFKNISCKLPGTKNEALIEMTHVFWLYYTILQESTQR
jgi:hypothetical protein